MAAQGLTVRAETSVVQVEGAMAEVVIRPLVRCQCSAL